MFFFRFYILCENFNKIGPIIKKIPNFVEDPLKIIKKLLSSLLSSCVLSVKFINRYWKNYRNIHILTIISNRSHILLQIYIDFHRITSNCRQLFNYNKALWTDIHCHEVVFISVWTEYQSYRIIVHRNDAEIKSVIFKKFVYSFIFF